ncbi:MAG TPA: hypothetical protein VFB15_11015 [Candidatus Binataceae bacterium]|nr:hypothetical protein [Candidatus Binataceae bacterium]
MQLEVKFVGAQPHEHLPRIALYTIDLRGAAKKVAVAEEGRLNLGDDPHRTLRGTIALGPDVADPAKLDTNLLQKFSAGQTLAEWEKNLVINVPAQWWRLWWPLTICLAGKVQRCFPIYVDPVPVLKNIALNRLVFPFPPIEFCFPICNGVVEVWESTCCCFPFLISDVPSLIDKLKKFLIENPVMFPPPPRPGPDPGPIDRVRERRVSRAIAEGKVDFRFAPNTQLHADLQALEASSPQEAVSYFIAHPSLWPIWCNCSVATLGEAGLQPDGSFQFCFEWFPIPFLPWCYRSYFYKVYQQSGGQLVCIYDGQAAHQYFAADDFANLSTLSGSACGNPNPIPGTDFVALQQIGSTSTHVLHSNYGVPSGTTDTTQTGAFSVAAPPSNGGLVNDNNAPWCKTLNFMLYFDPGMAALGAYYYRMSVAPADLNGNPVGPMQPILNPVAWAKYALGPSGIETDGQPLGPNTVGGNQGLYVIPYQSATVQPVGSTSPDQDWEGGQYHQYFNTADAGATPPGPVNGRFLLAVEIFNSAGQRLIPVGAPASPGDIPTSFNFIRLMPTLSGPGSTTNVPYAALTHLIWADNRPVVGEIDYFSLAGVSSDAECQFLSGTGDDAFQVGYRAYHAVLSDPNPPNPTPPSTFMSSYILWWERGLNGGSGTLDSGGDLDNPATRASGPPAESPAGNGLLKNLLPDGGPQACSFAIELDVYSKHTDGTYHYDDLDRHVLAAVALSRTS